ncbi:MAG TPA: adenosylcobinamide-GDP ribazoletransferase [Oxalicibacterium sp.]|nr:adenosylcobinamide-GDP ribazoletransferase [Oxalicibacterium sp.]
MELDHLHRTTPRARALQELRLFFTALQFYTRLPIPRWVGFDAQWLQQASRYFPAVGIVVALVTIVVYCLAYLLLRNQLVAVLLSTIAGILLTGAFHEDGFADACDGFGGGNTSERVIEIMTDSRVGAFGAIGIAMMLALKCATLAALPAPVVVTALLVAHPLSRLAAISLVRFMTYAKAGGKAKPVALGIADRDLLIAGLITLLPIVLFGAIDLMPWYGIAAGMLPAAGMWWWAMRFFQRRLGGYTGDCLGAAQQVTEVAFYLGVLAVVPR